MEIVSPGNCSVAGAVRAFVDKVWEFLHQRIHLLIIHPFPPDKRTPHGLHARIFAEVEDQPAQLPPDKPLSLIAYECRDKIQTYFEPLAVGDALVDMPVFLNPPEAFVEVPLEATYQAAWETVPQRWQPAISSTANDR